MRIQALSVNQTHVIRIPSGAVGRGKAFDGLRYYYAGFIKE